MGEGGECSRPDGEPDATPQGHDGERHGRHGQSADPLRPDRQDLPELLGSLGRYLEQHMPQEVVVLLRAELERRELRAYASGWGDAVAAYEEDHAYDKGDACTPDRAYDPDQWRTARAHRLSLVSRAQEQAAVIPFPAGEPPSPRARPAREEPDAAAATEGASPSEQPDRAAPPSRPETADRRTRRRKPRPERGQRPPRQDAAEQRSGQDAGAAPGLVAKNPGSKVPTIPRLPSRRRTEL
ncbi:hypothetical protein [Streptomyces sp. NPDC048442]|uniref:hypothetical protein n=1 Tax=Streptomyces sp. NPDC048442 TaxID=3154823 RepID=UPI0034342AA7